MVNKERKSTERRAVNESTPSADQTGQDSLNNSEVNSGLTRHHDLFENEPDPESTISSEPNSHTELKATVSGSPAAHAPLSDPAPTSDVGQNDNASHNKNDDPSTDSKLTTVPDSQRNPPPTNPPPTNPPPTNPPPTNPPPTNPPQTNPPRKNLPRTNLPPKNPPHTNPPPKNPPHTNPPPKNPPSTESNINESKLFTGLKIGGIVLGTVAGAVGAVALAPVVVAGVGFGAGGIAAGSAAASMMSTAATWGFGMGLVSALQSAGAAGIGLAANAIIGAGGAALGGAVLGGAAKVADAAAKISGGAGDEVGGRGDGRSCGDGEEESVGEEGVSVTDGSVVSRVGGDGEVDSTDLVRKD